MKLKYVKLLLLVFVVGSLSSCWWDEERDRKIDFLTDFEWNGDIGRGDSSGPIHSKFSFAVGGGESSERLHEIRPDGSVGKLLQTDFFKWRWRDGFDDVIEMRYYQNGKEFREFITEIFFDYRKKTFSGVHYLNYDDYQYDENGFDFTLYGAYY